MNEPKAFASLSSGLLARKGAAKPAMRPQGFGQMGASLEDLGWNDMGFEAPKPAVGAQQRDADHDAFGESLAEHPVRNPLAALTPSPVHGQQAELAKQFDGRSVEDDEEEEEEEETEDADASVDFATLAAPVLSAEPVTPAERRPDQQPETQDSPVAAQPVLSLKPEAAPVAERAAGPSEKVAVPRAESGRGPKAAFTLRLDAARHLRLRLACALTGRSAQMLVTDAVDKLLEDYPELDKFAGQLPDGGQFRRARG